MAKGRLFMQYFHNKNGTLKEEGKIRPKEMESFSVRDGNEPIFFLDYEFSNGNEYRISFYEKGLSVQGSFAGESEVKHYALTDGGRILEITDEEIEGNLDGENDEQ